jgi:hypothetical protein
VLISIDVLLDLFPPTFQARAHGGRTPELPPPKLSQVDMKIYYEVEIPTHTGMSEMQIVDAIGQAICGLYFHIQIQINYFEQEKGFVTEGEAFLGVQEVDRRRDPNNDLDVLVKWRWAKEESHHSPDEYEGRVSVIRTRSAILAAKEIEDSQKSDSFIDSLMSQAAKRARRN